jgi:hypothetical protein
MATSWKFFSVARLSILDKDGGQVKVWNSSNFDDSELADWMLAVSQSHR